MFWDNVAGVYDVFVNVINRKAHQKLRRIVSSLIEPGDTVLECACGTGLLSVVIASKCRQISNGNLLWTATNSFSGMQGILMLRSKWPKDASPAL